MHREDAKALPWSNRSTAPHNPHASDLGHKTRELCQIIKVEDCQNLSFLAIAQRVYDSRLLNRLATTSAWAKKGIARTRRKMPSKGLDQTDESHQTCAALEDNARAPGLQRPAEPAQQQRCARFCPIALVERAGQHRHVVHNSGKLNGKIPELCCSRMLKALVQMPDPCT